MSDQKEASSSGSSGAGGQPPSKENAAPVVSKRSASLFGFTKLFIVIETVQLIAIMHVFSLQVPYPDTFRIFYGILGSFPTLNWHYFLYDRGITGYPGLAQVIIVLVLVIVLLQVYRKIRAGWDQIHDTVGPSVIRLPDQLIHASTRKWMQEDGSLEPRLKGYTYLEFEKTMTLLFQFAYTPALLCGIPLLYCDSDSKVPFLGGEDCVGALHIVTIVLWLPLIPFIVWYPVWLYRNIRPYVTEADPIAHEMGLQGKELEYVARLDDRYEAKRLFLHSSFTRSGAYYRVWSAVSQLALVIIGTVLGPNYIGDLRGVQCALFCIVLCAPLLFTKLWSRQFRTVPSEGIRFHLQYPVALASLFSFVGVSDLSDQAFFQDTVSYLCIAAFVLGVAAACYYYYVGKQAVIRWPITQYHIVAVQESYPGLLALVNRASHLIHSAHRYPAEFMPGCIVVAMMKRITMILRANERMKRRAMIDSMGGKGGTVTVPMSLRYVLARSKDSTEDPNTRLVFYLAQWAQWAPLIFARTLEDLAHQLALLYDGLRRHQQLSAGDNQLDGMDTSPLGGDAKTPLVDSSQSMVELEQKAMAADMARFNKLRARLAGVRQAYEVKDRDRVLMNTKKRAFFNKLLSIAAMLGPERLRSLGRAPLKKLNRSTQRQRFLSRAQRLKRAESRLGLRPEISISGSHAEEDEDGFSAPEDDDVVSVSGFASARSQSFINASPPLGSPGSEHRSMRESAARRRGWRAGNSIDLGMGGVNLAPLGSASSALLSPSPGGSGGRQRAESAHSRSGSSGRLTGFTPSFRRPTAHKAFSGGNGETASLLSPPTALPGAHGPDGDEDGWGSLRGQARSPSLSMNIFTPSPGLNA